MICAGGTGGGVYPALAVVEALKGEAMERPDVETLWVGGEGGMEARLVERAGVPFKTIPAAGVHGVGLRALPHNLRQVSRGVSASRRILREFQPDALFFTGGYVAVPMALAGRKIPSLLYVPDIEPGLALSTLARFARRIAVTAEESRRYFRRPERVTLTGYPTRPALAQWTRSDARRTLKLNDKEPVLLIAGGSKGARSINNAVLTVLPSLLEKAQVIHVSGTLDWPTVEANAKELPATQAARYHAFPYLDEEMGAALAAADLALSRAGASTLGEYPLFGLPAVLVPYPYAWRYQKVNADYLVQRGAAVMIEDSKLPARLLTTVTDLLENQPKLASMRAAMQRLSHPRAAAEIGRLLLTLAMERREAHG